LGDIPIILKERRANKAAIVNPTNIQERSPPTSFAARSDTFPSYASACIDEWQYSSACNCVGVKPTTVVAPIPAAFAVVTYTKEVFQAADAGVTQAPTTTTVLTTTVIVTTAYVTVTVTTTDEQMVTPFIIATDIVSSTSTSLESTLVTSTAVATVQDPPDKRNLGHVNRGRYKYF
jgi:hypothetical protein